MPADDKPESSQVVQDLEDSGARPVKKGRADADSTRPICRRRALLIGVSRYESDTYRRLAYPINDVRELNQLLLGYGYDSVECIDDRVAEPQMQPRRDNICKALKRFCDEANADDLIWIHFSCHGMRWTDAANDPVKLLIAQDTRAADPLTTALRLEEDVLQPVRDCKARQKVISLDACQLGYGQKAAEPSRLDDLPFNLAAGMAVLFASTSEQYAWESKADQLGIFTACLIKAIRAEVEEKGYAELAQTVRSTLVEVTKWYKSTNRLPQHPTLSYDGVGELLLVDRRRKQANDPPTGTTSVPSLELITFRIPDYQLDTIISTNSLSLTLQARTSQLRDPTEAAVIITVLNKDFCTDKKYRSDRVALYSALATIKKLSHPGIAKVLDIGDTSTNLRYFVTEFLLGHKLNKALKNGFLTLQQVLQYSHELTKTVAAIHHAGWVHGDLSPEKIMITPEGPRILDVVTSALDVKLRLNAKQTARSPYWAPELTAGAERATEAVDVYALAGIFRELLGTLAPQVDGRPSKEIPKRLLKLIDKMQHPDPRQRAPLGEASSTLAELCKQQSPTSPRASRLTRWLLIGVSGAAAAGGAVWLLYHIDVPPPPPPPPQLDLGTADLRPADMSKLESGGVISGPKPPCRLSLSADGADVSAELDGQESKLSTQPYVIDVSSGDHSLSYRDDRGKVQKQTLTCSNGEPLNFHIKSPPPTGRLCRLSLTADRAGASAELDGKELKLSIRPYVTRVIPGDHSLRYRDERGEFQKQTLTCSNGKSLTFSIKSPRPPGLLCRLSLTADDADVSAELDGQELKLSTQPYVTDVTSGDHSLRYRDDQGEVQKPTLTCSNEKPLSSSLPISSFGQLLGEGIKLWEGQNGAEASARFDKVRKNKAAIERMTGPALERGRDVLALSSYYLAEVYRSTKHQRTNAPDLYEEFLRSAAARKPKHNNLVKNAQSRLTTLQKQLARYVYKVRVNDACQTKTAWVEPDRGISIKLKTQPPRTISVDLAAGEVKPGVDECGR